ncbi:MAG: type II toxin-antitoxin system RelE/ParE family toxin [Nanoarchaeota archaeon]|nr:type II toxin-antitoxin system RelE/ParE family toxin [Nanoarchaeota archaeon]
MDFSIQFTEEGKRTLHGLHISNQRQIKKELKRLRSKIKGKQLKGRLKGFFSFRFKKYRVMYSHHPKGIVIHYVGHRREVYGKGEENT